MFRVCNKMVVLKTRLTLVCLLKFAYGDLVNVALNKPVTASSRHGEMDLRKSVDGDTNGIIHTAFGQQSAWWNVDLQTNVHDASVEIYFRLDYKWNRNGVQIYTSATQFSSSSGGTLCHTIIGYFGRLDGQDIPDVVRVACSGSWRYLMIYTNTSNTGKGAILDFGEVKVTVCTSGSYGENCNLSCYRRHCAVTPNTCDRQTGICPNKECKAGWTGTDCAQACPSGRFGIQCSEKCGDCDGTCDVVDGQCPGKCLNGFSGRQCKIKLPAPSLLSSATVIAFLTGTGVGVVVILAVIGGSGICLIKLGRLRWKAESTKMADISTVVSHHVPVNGYEALDTWVNTDNTVYDVIQEKVYQNTPSCTT